MITFDFETKSYADLQKVGAWSYSEDATTDVICACWGIDDQPIQTWWPGKHRYNTMPLDLWDALVNGDHIEAHNVSFEYAIWKNVMGPKYGWAMPHEDAWRDLMAVACYYALPPKLDKLAMVLGYEGKDPDGARLISKYSKLHLKTAKPVIPQEDFERFVAYCYKDVQIEQSISDYLGDLPERELPVFLLDQTVNRRGLYLDANGIEAAARIVDQRAEELASEFRKIVGYNPTQRDKVLAWFNSHGLALENLQADTLEEVLEDGELGQGEVRRALEIRVAINKASTKKLDAMARAISPTTRRAYYQTRYHGAQTGRNTGQGLQPLNLNRGFEKLPPEVLVRDIMRGDAQWLDVCYGDAMDAIAKASRHWIMAAPGNKLLSGDFVSIEALVLACLAGEDWKVDMFRNKEPVYERMGDKIHGLPPGTVTKETHPSERQDGKTGELAFGYGGGLNAWLNFDSSGRHSDERIHEIKNAWRNEHPMIVKAWREWENEAIAAVRHPGRVTGYRDIGFEMVDEWLSMILPNGKRIWYFKPELRLTMPPWHRPKEKDECRDGRCDCTPRPQLTYMAQKFGRWLRISTYGGKLTENAVQATSRELLVPSAINAEKRGYSVILTVYDEIVSEVPKGFGSAKEFEEVMLEPLAGLTWASGWPIRVDAWSGERYRK